MKKHIFRLLVFLLTYTTLHGVCQAINKYDSLGRKQGIWHEYYDRKQDHIKAQNNYLDNRLDGRNYRYSKSGQLVEMLYYSNGTLLLYKTYFIKGVKKGQIKSIHGLKVNKTVSKYMYNEDLSNASNDSINFVDSLGRRQGVWHEVKIGTLFDPGAEEYYIVGNYINGKKEGQFRYYQYDGKQLCYEITFHGDSIMGRCIAYYLTGNIAAIRYYINGVKHGNYISFFENGNTREKGTHENDRFVGEYFRYSKRGRLVVYIKDAKINSPLAH